MQVQHWNELEIEQMNPLVQRQVLHTQNMTMARLMLKKGAVVPEHQHINEQISTVLEGSLIFQIAGQEFLVQAGDSMVIPPNVPHSVSASEDSLVIDLFSPRREDWLRGEDAYLRR
ncbi:MAG: cupin domain-containing protein [Bryobacteraceae bacterium]|nr:cupin domain-containing protein [Bryobacteraceae bacterium]MDW8379669.1 cupin domain-containing protein [Bryobacterales bacterium]